MYDDATAGESARPCDDQTFRLAVYEAGHALTARALGLKLVTVRMLPRPPVLVSEKTFANNKWDEFVQMLEIRIIELFGGQVAEEHVCGTHSCCGNDIARIDELSRLVAGLKGSVDAETLMFDLEDTAREIFDDPVYRDAILPIARFMSARVREGREVIDGADMEAEIARFIPPEAPKHWLKRMFSFGRG